MSYTFPNLNQGWPWEGGRSQMWNYSKMLQYPINIKNKNQYQIMKQFTHQKVRASAGGRS